MTVIQAKPKITVQNERGGTWFGNPFSHIPESQSSQPMFKKIQWKTMRSLCLDVKKKKKKITGGGIEKNDGKCMNFKSISISSIMGSKVHFI